jgi:hypothetical protein
MRIIIFPNEETANNELFDLVATPYALTILYWETGTHIEINEETGEEIIVRDISRIGNNKSSDGRIAVEYSFADDDWEYFKVYWSMVEQEDGSWLGDDGIRLVSELPGDWVTI